MIFNSFSFYVFISVVLAIYWSISRRWQWILLLLSSYFFYMSWNPRFAILIFLTTLVSYLSALLIEKYRQQKKTFLFLAVIIDMGILFLFKYFTFFWESVQIFMSLFAEANFFSSLNGFHILLPVGISFYTFQTVSYVIDVYRGEKPAEKHFGYFALFVSFFPQLVAGPIERAENLLPQLKKQHYFEYDSVVSGVELFIMGLFKKIVIADNLAIIVDRVFESLPEYRGLSLVIAIFLFSWQIYCDFSGYTDMARGIARVLGIRLVEDFRHPYQATSVTDFWRRWHISLSEWFKDYLYIPLGGNRKGIPRTLINLLIVFVLCGLWHGAAWTFVLWGFFHGSIMALERILFILNKNRFSLPKMLSGIYAYSMVLISWVLFRAQTLDDVMYIYRNSVTGILNVLHPSYVWATLNQLFLTNRLEMLITFFCLFIIIFWEFSHSILWPKKMQQLLKIKSVRWVFYALAFILIFLLGNTNIKEFIYFQF